MNGAIRARPISSPLTSPMTPHTTQRQQRPRRAVPQRAPYAVSTPASASSDPTDRSMPPLRMTNVMPIAISSR